MVFQWLENVLRPLKWSLQTSWQKMTLNEKGDGHWCLSFVHIGVVGHQLTALNTRTQTHVSEWGTMAWMRLHEFLQHNTTWLLIRRRASNLFRVTNQLLARFTHGYTIFLTHKSYTIRTSWLQRSCDGLCRSRCRDGDLGWFRVGVLVNIFPFQYIRHRCVTEGFELDCYVHLAVSRVERAEVGN